MSIEGNPRTFTELRRAANMRRRMGLPVLGALQLETSLNGIEARSSSRRTGLGLPEQANDSAWVAPIDTETQDFDETYRGIG